MEEETFLIAEITEKRDIVLSRPIFWFTVLSCFCVFGREVLAPLGIPANMYTLLRYGMSTVLILWAMKYVKRKMLLWLFGVEVLFGISYLYSYLSGNLYSENILTYCISTLVICIPFCALIASMNKYEYLYHELKKASLFNIIVLTIYLYITLDTVTYSMPASYQVLFCFAIHWNELFKKTTKIKYFYIGLVILEIILLFVRGSRGPIFCLGVYILLKAFCDLQYSKRALYSVFFGSAALALIMLKYQSILYIISNTLSKYNISSRFFNQIISATLLNDSGRGAFQNMAIEMIFKSPIIGYGASSDVKLLGGQYAHSFFLEVIFDFGIFIGFAIFLYVTIKAFRVFFWEPSVARDIAQIFFVCSYVMLFVSGTYLQSHYLFLLVGISMRMDRPIFKVSYGKRNHL